MAWRKHVSDAVYLAVASAMGLDPDNQSTIDRIVPAYVSTEVTTPQYNVNDNVVFFDPQLESAPEAGWVTVRGEDGKIAVTKTIPVSLLLTFYGPDADDDSEQVWSRLMVDYGAGSPRAILRANNIVFNYGLGRMPPRPVQAPELEGTLWRRRCDLRLSLSYLCTDEVGMNPVEEVPEIEFR